MRSQRNFVRITFFLVGMALFGMGLLIGLLEIVAIVDPVGTKMSDDSDPFGDPTISIWQHLVFILVTLALIAGGSWFLRLANKTVLDKK
jgi:hypothetical protein